MEIIIPMVDISKSKKEDLKKKMDDLGIYEKDLETAKKIGRDHNQIAIYDLKNYKEIDTGGTGEAVTLKEKLTKKISSDKPKQSDYIKRRLAEFKDKPELTEGIEKITVKNSPKLVLAEQESEKLVRDFQKEYGEVDGLMKVSELARDNKLPALMSQIVFPKVYTRLLSLGEIAKSNEVLEMQSIDLTEASHKMIGAQEGTSPEQTVSRVFAGLEQGKQESLDKEFEAGKTYNSGNRADQSGVFDHRGNIVAGFWVC